MRFILEKTLPPSLKEAVKGYDWLVLYIDDITIGARNQKTCLALLEHVLRQFTLLGLTVNTKKTQWPTQFPRILGFDYDIQKCAVAVPKDKALEISSLLNRYIVQGCVQRMQLERLAGKLAHIAPALWGGMALVRSSLYAFFK